MPTPAEVLFERLAGETDAIGKAIDQKIAAFDRSVSLMEKELFRLLVEQFLSRLQVRDGRLVNSVDNLATLAKIDDVLTVWRREFVVRALRGYVKSVLEVVAQTGELYRDAAPSDVLERIAQDNASLRAAIGINARGAVVPGSFLAELGLVSAVRQDIKNIVLSGIQGGSTITAFQNTLRDFVTGNRQVDGRLRRYYRQYAFDVWNQAFETKNKQFADALGLRWFIYAGDIIRTTRTFCRKKVGKVFAVEEAVRTWPNDPDLIGRTRPEVYNPIRDRGRWNCRHRIRYISEELARQIDPAKVDRIKETLLS
jgi:hypothetical protein